MKQDDYEVLKQIFSRESGEKQRRFAAFEKDLRNCCEEFDPPYDGFPGERYKIGMRFMRGKAIDLVKKHFDV